MRSMYLKTFLVVMVILGVSLPSMAAVVNYSISGGPNSLITGTLGANSFTNATWKVSATADNSHIHEFITNNGQFDLPIRVLPNTDPVTLEIFQGSSVFTATLNPNTGFQYVVVTADFRNDPEGGPYQGAGILHWDLGGNLEYGAGLIAGGSLGGTEGLYDSLTNLGSYAGGFTFFFDDQDIEFISTSAGNLKVTGRSGGLQGGVWQAGVPEPSSLAIFAVGTLGMAYRARRKRHLA
ncbi:MAG: PEP-CTERM sorting domain-containing protein [Planctomycetaceae bacterium]|jgi:hypothetical protein|nr:PEP-CTERM sorting domain-containing protein [Planctomycetaceae bacterium]MCE2814522.1 PEP-CTERM sorting domain-containing protein [Planctomycetaceae bacterium]